MRIKGYVSWCVCFHVDGPEFGPVSSHRSVGSIFHKRPIQSDRHRLIRFHLARLFDIGTTIRPILSSEDPFRSWRTSG